MSPLCSFEEKIEGQLYLVTVCDYFPDHDYLKYSYLEILHW